jgi:hypothetical protein
VIPTREALNGYGERGAHGAHIATDDLLTISGIKTVIKRLG